MASVVFAAGGPVGAFAAPSGPGSQLWTELDVLAPVGPGAAIELLGETGAGPGGPNPTYVEGGALLDVKLASWTVGGGAVWEASRPNGTGAFVTVPRPMVVATYVGPLGVFSIEDRNRLEVHDTSTGADTRYRNRLTIYYPLAHARPINSVFVGDEVFYDFARHGLSENRVKAGVVFPISRASHLDLYVQRVDFRFAQRTGLNVIGLTYKATLGR